MRKWLAALVVAASLTAAGCSVNVAFVKAVEGYADAILPEYEAYVNADPRLDPDTRRIRLQTAQRFRLLVDEAKKE